MTEMTREFNVQAADARLRGVDTAGAEPALVLVNGGFATQRNWKHVLQRLGGRYRTVTFDARGRGRSGTSSDYTFHSAVQDVGRVIEETKVQAPILVGWSHGATLAVRYATQHPDQVRGLVLIDGAYPISMFDAAGKEHVRKQFRRLAVLMRIASLLGLSAKLTAAQSAQVVIEMDEVNGDLEGDFAALRCPTVFVVASGAHSGASEHDNRTMRAAVTKATASNERVQVFATTDSNHVQILTQDADAVADAIQDVIKQTA